MVTVATDGSSKGNPGPAGWAWVVDGEMWQAGSIPNGTSIVAELTAIYRLLLAAPPQVALRVLSDSEFAVNVCSRWAASWRKNGWRKRDGQPIANQALVAALDEAIRARTGNLSVEWVRGHNGHPLNEAADRLATKVAVNGTGQVAGITGPGWARMSASAANATVSRRTVMPASSERGKFEICGSCDGPINPLTLHCRCGSL